MSGRTTSASPPVGLYIHVPFCARACPYCDFDFVVGRRPAVGDWLDALEVEWGARPLHPGQPVHTVYVGGGTPSLIGPEGLRRLWAWIESRFDTSACVERTVELNPEHVDDALLDALVDVGVERVSLGVQSLGSDALIQLGRVHRGEGARLALRAAVERGLRVSADLIVGWPGQDASRLHADLEGIVAAGVEHVSIYALTVEPGTPWDALERKGRRRRPDPDAQADRLHEAARWLGAAGFEHYEVASYGRAGVRARHNLGYWTGRDYLGFGPSAASAIHGTDGAVWRRTNARGLSRWSEAPGRGGSEERLSPLEAAAEALWLGLRVLDGFSADRFLRRFSGVVDEAWLRARLSRSVSRGNVEWTSDGIVRVVPDRWLWHDEIGADLLEPPE